MKGNRKLIFLDIDGTLISERKAPSDLAAEAVRLAREKGHKVFLCTGRNMAIIGEDILCLGFDGIIASAGGHVEAEGRVLFDSILPEETVQEALSVFHRHGIFCRIESPEGIYTDPQTEALLVMPNPQGTHLELIRMQKEIEAGIPIQPYERYPEKGAYKICITGTDPEKIEETRKYLGDRFHYVLQPWTEDSACVNGEIISREFNKGKGMELICGCYGADMADTVAFGDSMNDYEMIQAAGMGIAMGNACRELKQAADRVCGGVREDGIYYEFREMGLC